MTRITLHFPSLHSSQGQHTAPQTPMDLQGAQQSVAAGKRRYSGTADFLTSAPQRIRTEHTVPSARRVELAFEKWMDKNFEDSCEALVAHICEKPAATDGAAAGRKEAVEQLIANWLRLAQTDRHINARGMSTQRLLIAIKMLAKIVRSEDGTYEDACKRLRTMQNPLAFLTAKATAYYSALQKEDPKLPCLAWDTREGYGCMALMGLYDELVRDGHELPVLARIVNARSNYGALLLIASDIMNQPPFTSGSDRGNLSEANRALSSIARKVQVARYEGSVSTIFALLEQFPALRALGFSPDEARNMVCHNSAAKTIGTVLAHYDELIAKGFKHGQIVGIASHFGGTSNIAAVAKHAVELKNMKFTCAHITKIASHSTGTLNIELTRNYAAALIRKGVSHDEIVRRVSSRDNKQQKVAELQPDAESVDTIGEQEMGTAELVQDNAAADDETRGDVVMADGVYGEEQSWTPAEREVLLGMVGEGEQAMLVEDAVSQPAAWSWEPFSDAEAPDVEELPALLMARDGEFRDLLMKDPFPIARAGASADQAARDLHAYLEGETLRS
jgi:hypothetical protein